MPWIRISLISIASVLLMIYFESSPSIYDISGIVSTFAAVSGTLLGFIVAALSILTAMINRRLIGNLKKTGHYKELLDNFFITAGAYLLTMVFSLLTLFLSTSLSFVGLCASTFLMVWATSAFVVTGKKFSLLLFHVGQD